MAWIFSLSLSASAIPRQGNEDILGAVCESLMLLCLDKEKAQAVASAGGVRAWERRPAAASRASVGGCSTPFVQAGLLARVARSATAMREGWRSCVRGVVVECEQ